LQGGGAFGLGIMILFGLIGFLAKKFDYSFVTFLIGYILGPSFELSLRQSLALVHDPVEIWNHPIAIVFGVITVLGIWQLSRMKRRASEETHKTIAEA
jgi:putative tricarboxylic transport membrane protein